MKNKRDNDPDFDHIIKVAVYAFGAATLMWVFINFVILLFE